MQYYSIKSQVSIKLKIYHPQGTCLTRRGEGFILFLFLINLKSADYHLGFGIKGHITMRVRYRHDLQLLLITNNLY